jgi:hypothetical protein
VIREGQYERTVELRLLLQAVSPVDEVFARELDVAAETSRDVADEVLRFIERNYPLPEVA